VHNMCRLPGSDGTWMMVAGGMGRLTDELARLAQVAGASIRTGMGVERIALRGGRAAGLVLCDGREVQSRVVVCNADPFRLRELVGAQAFPEEFNARPDGMRRLFRDCYLGLESKTGVPLCQEKAHLLFASPMRRR